MVGSVRTGSSCTGGTLLAVIAAAPAAEAISSAREELEELQVAVHLPGPSSSRNAEPVSQGENLARVSPPRPRQARAGRGR